MSTDDNRITEEELDIVDSTEKEADTSHSVPQELQDYDQWLCWEEVEDDDGKVRKVPKEPDASDSWASTSDPTTWDSFEEAVEACRQRRGLGIGFVLTEDDPYLAVDFDDVRDPDSDETEDWVLEAIDRWDSYTEISPSGTGLHVWLKDATQPDWWTNTEHIEVYESGQYITVTGNHFSDTPTKCLIPSKFDEWLQENADLDVPEPPSQESQDESDESEEDINLGVYDVLSRSSYPEGERVSHPYHGSSTDANFKVFEGGETWHCFRHEVTGNALHLVGMETGVISCGDWKNRELTDQEWAELFEAGREAGYDLPGHPDERQQESTEGNITEAIIESPSDWIWPDKKTIIARPVGDLEAREVKNRFEQQALDSDDVVELMAELEDEYSDAFSEFWKTPEAWSVNMEGPDHSWRRVRGLYSEYLPNRGHASFVTSRTSRESAA